MTLPTRAEIFRELYHWLAACLHRPERDIFSAALIGEVKALYTVLALETDEELNILTAQLSTPEAELEPLLVEHSRLFVGPFALLAPPYESLHRGDKALMGQISRSVLSHYARAGLGISDELREAPDHIVLELSFLSALCDMEGRVNPGEQATNEGDLQDPPVGSAPESIPQWQREFLTEHLLGWVCSFDEVVREHAKLPFYPIITRLVCLTAQAHHRHLSEAVRSSPPH